MEDTMPPNPRGSYIKKRDPNWKWLRELGFKIVLAKRGKKAYTRKIKHKLKEME
tara:strand:+ start:668 stop:829 length:162 start_codon:yes stop_codon:yes gene_type:complete